MTDTLARRTWKHVVVDLLLVAICTGSMWYLFSPQLDQPSLFGGDNAEWRDEALDRQSWGSVFDYRFHSGRGGPSAYYNPVQMLIWKVMIATFDYGTEPRPYFVLCLLIHALNVMMVFLIARELLGRSLLAFCAATCFALFLPNYHTAGWMSGIVTTGVSGFFLFVTIYFFMVFYRTRRRLFLVLSCISYVVGLFTKEFVVFAIPILAAYYLATQRERTLRPKKGDLVFLPYCLLTIPMAYIVLARLGNSAIVNDWGGFNFGIHMAYRFADLLGFLCTAEPADRSVRVACVAVALALLPALMWAARRDHARAFAAAWFAIALLVYTYSNFRDVYSLQRYLYQPSAPWFILLFSLIPRGRRWLYYLSVAMLSCGVVGYNVFLLMGTR